MAKPGDKLGDYTLLSLAGEGGMAQVFAAQKAGPPPSDTIYALKVVREELSQKRPFVRMFCDEARITQQLNHPNIVRVHELNEFQGIYFMVMEFIHGETLTRIRMRASRTEGEIPIALIVHIAAEVAEALHAVHHARSASGLSLGLVHCDVSLGNIMVDYMGRVRLLDFGVAQAKGRLIDSRMGLRGKVAYMSPERLRGQAIDHRSDLFSLAVVVWELLTGRRLFKRSTPDQTRAAVLTGRVPPPSEFRADVPKRLDEILLKALQSEVASRQQAAFVLRDELRSILNNLSPGLAPIQLASLMKTLFPLEDVKPAVIDSSDAEDLAAETPSDVHRPPLVLRGSQGIRIWLFAVLALLMCGGVSFSASYQVVACQVIN